MAVQRKKFINRNQISHAWGTSCQCSMRLFAGVHFFYLKIKEPVSKRYKYEILTATYEILIHVLCSFYYSAIQYLSSGIYDVL